MILEYKILRWVFLEIIKAFKVWKKTNFRHENILEMWNPFQGIFKVWIYVLRDLPSFHTNYIFAGLHHHAGLLISKFWYSFCFITKGKLLKRSAYFYFLTGLSNLIYNYIRFWFRICVISFLWSIFLNVSCVQIQPK